MKILPVIMCGGSGTRVWPESRESLPKQFISLIGAQSTFQMAAEMLDTSVFETPIVISNSDYRFLVAEQLQKIKREARIVLEPIRRDSGRPSPPPPNSRRNRGQTRSSRFWPPIMWCAIAPVSWSCAKRRRKRRRLVIS